MLIEESEIWKRQREKIDPIELILLIPLKSYRWVTPHPFYFECLKL